MDIKDTAQFEGLKTVIHKAWDDDDFRASLVANPRAALKGEGLDLPEDIDLEVTDQTDADTVHLVIPNEEQFRAEASKKLEDMELSDEELEIVSGGEVFLLAGIIISGSMVAATSVAAAGVAGYGVVRGVQKGQEDGW